MNDITFDFANYSEESDIFMSSDLAAFERDLVDLRESFDQHYDKYSGSRRKLAESATLESSEDVIWPDYGIDAFDTALDSFETKQYRAEKRLKSNLKELEQKTAQKSPKKVAVKTSIQSRFLQSIRNESKTVRMLECDLGIRN